MHSNEVIDLKGYQAARSETEEQAPELRAGTTLLAGQYTLTNFLNSGGFGITYRAKDSLLRDVVIKECYPSALCIRTGNDVQALKPGHKEDLAAMVDQFVAEARSMAVLDHDNIVRVHQIFKENQTAYMSMDFIDGPDLLEMSEESPELLPPQEIERLTKRILAAIRYVHDRGLLHRDISPDNILVDRSGEPILIDFGAAHQHARSEGDQPSRPKFVKDGYSPLEFYGEEAEQGAWSDLYSFGATLYHVITGAPPPDAQRRLKALECGKSDPYVPLAGRFDGFRPACLRAIDKSLSL